MMNPNLAKFKKLMKSEDVAENQKPVLFVYQPEVMSMIPNVDELNDALKEHSETFDIYYSKDPEVVNQLFWTRKLPDLMPFVMVIDPTQRIALKQQKVKNGDVLQPKKERPLSDGSYPFKSQGYIFLNSIKTDLNKFIQQFLDDEQQMVFTTKPREQQSSVQVVTAETFEEVALKQSDCEHIILEVFKEHCGACSFSAPVFKGFSRKLEKHGFANDFKLVRTNIDNQIPQLGNFQYTPIYFYIRKDRVSKQITQIETVQPVGRGEVFINKI